MKNIFLLFLIFFCFNIYCDNINPNESQFIIKKTAPNITPARLRESIIKNSGVLLKRNLKLDKFSISLREILLDQIEMYFNEDQKSFLISSNKVKLQEFLNELIDLRRTLDKNLLELERKLQKLKNMLRFQSNIEE